MKIYTWLTLAILTISQMAFASSVKLEDPLFINQKTAGYQLGDAVGNFRLKSTSGNMVSLSDFNDSKAVIVIFTSNHCPFAKAYEDRIIALHNKFAGQGIALLAINPSDGVTQVDDSFEKMKERAASKGYGFPYMVDENQSIAKAFGVARVPQAFVLQKNGSQFTIRYIGMIDDNPQDPAGATKFYVEDAVNNLLGGKPVVTTVTKPIGCAIKWKQ